MAIPTRLSLGQIVSRPLCPTGNRCVYQDDYWQCFLSCLWSLVLDSQHPDKKVQKKTVSLQ
jgi:hypothetical protein